MSWDVRKKKKKKKLECRESRVREVKFRGKIYFCIKDFSFLGIVFIE